MNNPFADLADAPKVDNPFADLADSQPAENPFSDLADAPPNPKSGFGVMKFASGINEGLNKVASGVGTGLGLAEESRSRQQFSAETEEERTSLLNQQDMAKTALADDNMRIKQGRRRVLDDGGRQEMERILAGASKRLGVMSLAEDAMATRNAEPFNMAAANSEETAQGFARMKQASPGPDAMGEAGTFVGTAAGMIAPSMIPGVGPALGPAVAGLSSAGNTYEQSKEAYVQAGLPEAEAEARAREVAGRTGLITGAIFAVPVGKLSAMPKSQLARLLASSGLGGSQMGLDTLQAELQAKATYNPNLTFGQIVKDSGKSFAGGAFISGLMHSPGWIKVGLTKTETVGRYTAEQVRDIYNRAKQGDPINAPVTPQEWEVLHLIAREAKKEGISGQGATLQDVELRRTSPRFDAPTLNELAGLQTEYNLRAASPRGKAGGSAPPSKTNGETSPAQPPAPRLLPETGSPSPAHPSADQPAKTATVPPSSPPGAVEGTPAAPAASPDNLESGNQEAETGDVFDELASEDRVKADMARVMAEAGIQEQSGKRESGKRESGKAETAPEAAASPASRQDIENLADKLNELQAALVRRQIVSQPEVLTPRVNEISPEATAAAPANAGGTPTAQPKADAPVAVPGMAGEQSPTVQPTKAVGDSLEQQAVERFQWMANKEGGQKTGNRQITVPLTGALFQEHIKPKLRKGYAPTFDKYQAKHPDETHISFYRRESDGHWVMNKSGSLEALRPNPPTPKWVTQVDSFDSPAAQQQAQTADSDSAPVPTSEAPGTTTAGELPSAVTPPEVQQKETEGTDGNAPHAALLKKALGLTPAPTGESVTPAGAATSTVRTDAPTSVTDERTGSAMTADPTRSDAGRTPATSPSLADQITAAEQQVRLLTNAHERAARRGTKERLETARQKLASARATLKQLKDRRAFEAKKARGITTERYQADRERAGDIIDDVAERVGSFDYTKTQDEDPAWKPIGAARKLHKHGSRTLDSALDALHRDGLHLNIENTDEFRQAINAAASVRKGARTRVAAENRKLDELGAQRERFERDAAKPAKKNQEPLIADTLNEGDTFEMNGVKFKVTALEFDENLDVASVTLDDGKRYGTQTVDGETRLVMDKGTLDRKEADTSLGTELYEPGASYEAGGFAFDDIESVTEQKARQAAEKRKEESGKAKNAMLDRADARLTGADVDTTREMFGAEVKVDKTGQGSLFEPAETYSGQVDKPQLHGLASERSKELHETYGIAQSLQNPAWVREAGQPYQGELPLSDSREQRFPDDRPAPAVSDADIAAAQARALKSGAAADLAEAFRLAGQIYSIDPAKAPRASGMTYNVVGMRLRTPLDFVLTLLPLRNPYQESLKVAVVEKLTGKVVHSEVLYTGTIDTISVHPLDFARLGQQFGGAEHQIVLSHNHPGGDPTPSDADLRFTRELQQAARAAGFSVGEHIITNGTKYAVLPADFDPGAYSVETIPNAVLAEYENVPRGETTPLLSDADFARLANALRQTNQKHNHLIYVSTRNRIIAIERIPDNEPLARYFRRTAPLQGASGVFVDFSEGTPDLAAAASMTELKRVVQGMKLRFLDARWAGIPSARAAGYLSETPGEYQAGLQEPEAPYSTEIAAAEAELRAAIRQTTMPGDELPPGGRAAAFKAKREAAAKLRALIARQLEQMTGTNVDAVRSPEERSALIAQTVDLLNSMEDEIAALNARSEAVPAEYTKLRADLQTRLKLLKGWADDATDEAIQAGKRSKPAAPVGQQSRFVEVESATDDGKTAGEWWQAVKDGLRKLASPVPEIPLYGPESERAATFLRGFRLFNAETNRVRKEAAEKVNAVVGPLVEGRSRQANAAQKHWHKLGNRLRRLRKAGKDAEADAVLAQMNKIEETKLRNDPFNIFRKLVLYRDLYWRATNLKTPDGRDITLPNNLTADDVMLRLRELTTQMDAHPMASEIKAALRRHYTLTNELQESIMDHGEIIPEMLKNPLYFPHHMVEHWKGTVDQVRPSTEEDFRRYLITPVGSSQLLQADYLKAMYVHTADVLAHNARVDLVQKYWQPYDISQKLKDQHGEDWDKSWNTPGGYRLYAPFKKIPLRMDYILDRETLAQKLGVKFNDGDLRERLKESGAVIDVKPEDLHGAMVAGEKIKWVLPNEVADALDGIARREAAARNPGFAHAVGLPLRASQRFWKKWTLFMPLNWLRYEYGNLSTDVVDKVLVNDPGILRLMPRAARELWASTRDDFAPTPEFQRAEAEGVFDTITAAEAGELQRLPSFKAFQTTGEATREQMRRALETTMRGSKFRESVFRYASYLANLERMRKGEEPVYGGAYAGDIEALGQVAEGAAPVLQGEDLMAAKAAEITMKTFGDYGSLAVASQWLRDNVMPFWSWNDVNLRYHANQLRNIADVVLARQMANKRQAATYAVTRGARMTWSALRVMAGLALVNLAAALWNEFGGVMAGLWDDDDDLEGQLSEADRRRPHLIMGKDDNGKVMVIYTPSAFGDVLEWVGGNNLKRLVIEYLKGERTLTETVTDYATQAGPDFVNKLAQGTRPEAKTVYELTSGKATFPDVFDQRNIPKSEKWWRVSRNFFGEIPTDLLRNPLDKDYMGRPMAEQLQQAVLQVRRRDPEQWAYYKVREDAADWKEQKTGKRYEGGNYTAAESQALRNFRRSIYQGDVAGAERFYLRLLEYGYTAERLAASIRAQHPLADLNKQQQREYLETLTEKAKRELDLAVRYYDRMATLDHREKTLFPTKAAAEYGVPFTPNPERLREMMESAP